MLPNVAPPPCIHTYLFLPSDRHRGSYFTGGRSPPLASIRLPILFDEISEPLKKASPWHPYVSLFCTAKRSGRDIFMVARLTSYSLKSKVKALGLTVSAPAMLRIPIASWHFPALASWPCKAARPTASRLLSGTLFDEIQEPLKTFPEVKLLCCKN